MLAPGFEGAKRDLTIRLVRILFPGAGLLVFSAWCLGILNSHRRFLLSYSAPVVWNAAIIVATLLPGAVAPETTVLWTAWGAVAGSLLQLLVQLPGVRRLAGGFRPLLAIADEGVRTVIRNFVPAFLGRGVVQVSAFVDAIIASLLPTGAVAAILNAQLLYTLPVSLFGMSVAAAELPELSAAAGEQGGAERAVRERIARAQAQVSFYVLPSALAFLCFGGVVAAAVFQTGLFSAEDSRYVWGILAGSSLGLLATTLSRLYSSAWYALLETRKPVRYALVRVALTVVLGFLAATRLPGALGIPALWGAAGLTLAGSVAGWVEFGLLKRSLQARLGPLPIGFAYLVRLTGAGLAAASVAAVVWYLVSGGPGVVLRACLVLGAYGLVYLGLTWHWRVPAARDLVDRLQLGG